jgi:hypothetical protein
MTEERANRLASLPYSNQCSLATCDVVGMLRPPYRTRTYACFGASPGASELFS